MHEPYTLLWFKRFKDGRQSTCDEMIGRRTMSCDDACVAQAHETVCSNHRLVVREIAEE
jgi:hypothetical protein